MANAAETQNDSELAAEFPDLEPSKQGFRKRVAQHLAWQHSEALIDDLAERGLLGEYSEAAIATLKATILEAQHNVLAEAGVDHHEIQHCRCDVAQQWASAKEVEAKS